MILPSDNFIKNTLRNYDRESEKINIELEHLIKRASKKQDAGVKESILDAVAYPKTGSQLGIDTNVLNDLSITYDKYTVMQREALSETIYRIKSLTSKQEKMDLIMKAYYALPDDNEGKNALKYMYVISSTWKEGRGDYMTEYKCSETTVKNHYRKGLRDIKTQMKKYLSEKRKEL